MVAPGRILDPSPGTTRATRVVGVLLIVGTVALFFLRAPDGPIPAPVGVEDSADGGVAQLPPRCVAHGPELGVSIGKASDDGEGFVPFAAEVGRGTALRDGFAVGVKHQIEGVTHAAVAVVDAEAKTVTLHNFAKTRGDVDAPLVVAQGEGWVGAVLEPNASGMSVRLMRVRGTELQWGAEIEQGRDESLAFDVAFADQVGVVTWDDVADEPARGVVMLATVTVESLEGGEKALEISGERVDAELPRVVPRNDGFWLAYVARARVEGGADAGVLVGGRFRAERIEPSWIELVPLDAEGKPESEPTPVTSQDGYVLAFDLEPAVGGNALITWRDDDAPSGAAGGRVTSQLVTPSGSGQIQTITEEGVGAGVPAVVAGWIALPSRGQDVRLAPMGPDGELTGGLRVEPLLRRAQLIVSANDVLLMAKPAGRAVRLFTVRCTGVTGLDASAP